MKRLDFETIVGLSLGCAVALSCGDDGGSTTLGSATETSTSTTTTDTTSTSTTGTDETTTGETTSGPGESCEDGVQNQDESDIDCGGTVCPRCDDGQSCGGDTDCMSQTCVDGTCSSAACDDGVTNGDETDVDCGGSCTPCGDGQSCLDAMDCISGMCTDGMCAVSGCADGVQNGDETDVDCGGMMCFGCENGDSCLMGTDCQSGSCENDICIAVGCQGNNDCNNLDGECQVGICDANNECQAQAAFNGAACNDGDLCSDSICTNGMCAGPPKDCSFLDGECSLGTCDTMNGNCFNMPLNDNDPCDDGDPCTVDEFCLDASCGNGDPKDCSFLDGECQVGACNQFDGDCEVELSDDDTPCDDGFACSTGETCQNGACVPQNLGDLFNEDFADNGAGWTLGTEWEIGSAAASNCSTNGEDPAMDHTSGNDNGVAGVVLGGCAATNIHPDYCIESPVVDISGATGPVILDFWRHLHSDYTPFMQNTIEVYDGNMWVPIWQSGPSPAVDDNAWTQLFHELTQFKNANFQVRFCFNIDSGGVWTVASWNLDDIAIASCP